MLRSLARILVLTLIGILGGQSISYADKIREENNKKYAKIYAKMAKDEERKHRKHRRNDIKLPIYYPKIGVYALDNFGYDIDKGEPTNGGLMRRTGWMALTPPENARVVVHTVGTEFDTVLAAYTGERYKSLKRIDLSDNKAIPGFNSTLSVIQFDAKKGVEYSIQLGSKTGKQGDIFENIMIFPPNGGIAAYLATMFGSSVENEDFYCDNYGCTPAFTKPTFLVYNSMDKTVTVTPSNSFGAGVSSPPSFTLAAGAFKAVTFDFTSGFDTTTVRAVGGTFYFDATRGTTLVAHDAVDGLVVIHPPAGTPETLTVHAEQPIRSGFVNEDMAFDVEMKNTGVETAVGCHVRPFAGSRLKIWFERLDTVKHSPVGDPNVPFSIPAGGTAWVRAHVASQETRTGDPIYNSDVIYRCANAKGLGYDLRDRTDVSARGLADTADVKVAITSPAGDLLLVPKNGQATALVEAVNQGGKGKLTALTSYSAASSSPLVDYKVTVCRTTKSGGPCLAPAATSVELTMTKNAKAYFKLFVKAPPSDPGYNPAEKRAYLRFRQPPNFPTEQPEDAVVGAQSIALKRK